MTYAPGGTVAPPMVSLYTSGWTPVPKVLLAGASSATFESANRAVYTPLFVPVTCIARRLWWVNGSSVSASYNIDVGIYADGGYKPGTKIVSTGSTAQGTASQVQFVDITDTTLAPGLYWVAITDSSTSSTLYRFTVSPSYDAVLRFEEASALPLPATATPVEATASSLYLCGFATTASP